jgi:hypothetical protein
MSSKSVMATPVSFGSWFDAAACDPARIYDITGP